MAKKFEITFSDDVTAETINNVFFNVSFAAPVSIVPVDEPANTDTQDEQKPAESAAA